MLLAFLLNAMITLAPVYKCQNGVIAFRSDAPLELINAKSTQLKGVIDPATGNFGFSVASQSFQGFNSPLQKEHFDENYIESGKFEKSKFEGKIIEKVDFTKNGKQTVRAKGILTMHGIARERIIKSDIQIQDKKISVQSKFTVLLAEHKITIPKLVYQKIAEEIEVTLNATFNLE
jgi:polyisoprenoid-binding protein YceI